MARNIIGRWLLEFERAHQSHPLAGSVYKTLKQLLKQILQDNSTRFRRFWSNTPVKACSCPFCHRRGGSFPAVRPDQPLLSVFIPTAPNPTTGWYTLVPELPSGSSTSRWKRLSARLSADVNPDDVKLGEPQFFQSDCPITGVASPSSGMSCSLAQSWHAVLGQVSDQKAVFRPIRPWKPCSIRRYPA